MPDPASSRRKRTVVYGCVLLVLVALVLLLRGCPKGVEGPFDYFQAKAVELGRDPGRVARFVTDEVKALPYQGNVKGALATLWEGAGSPGEKAALHDALLRHCPGSEPAGATQTPILA